MHRRAVKRPLSPSVPQLAPNAPGHSCGFCPSSRRCWSPVRRPIRAGPPCAHRGPPGPAGIRPAYDGCPLRPPTRPRGLRSAHLWRTSSVRSPRSRRRPGMSSSSLSTWTCGARHALCCTPALAPLFRNPAASGPTAPASACGCPTRLLPATVRGHRYSLQAAFRDRGRVFPVRPADAPRQPLHRRRGRQVHQHTGQ